MADRVGQQIGNYRLIHLLGEGGFAEVYLGEHLYLGTHAAIKILHTQLTSDDIEPFRSEARIIANLEHPNIVRVLDFGVEGKTPFLIMGYAPNGTLRQLHHKGMLLPLTTIVHYVKQVADALQYAHDQRLIHRDVKPENMLLGRRNEVLLSDFGIALVAQSSHYQTTRDVVGTVAYMAPEQIQGKPRPASDQYALGIVVYEWLSGVRPFHGSFTEIAVQHAVAPAPPLREKLPSISPDVEQIVLTALAKDPQQRFASVQAFANALEQAYLPTQRISFVPPGQSSQPPVTTSKTNKETDVTIAAAPSKQPLEADMVGTLYSRLEPAKPSISRRMILAGLAGLAVTAAGGLTWLALSQRQGTGTPPGSTTHSGQFAAQTVPPTSAKPTDTPTLPKPTNTPTQTTITSPLLGTTFTIYRGHTGYIYGVTWSSSDGQRIASASLDTTVQAWNATTGTRYFTYNHSAAVNDVKSSHNKTHLASAGEDSVVQVRDAANGALIFTYRNHRDAVNTVEWSSDDTRIVSASKDRTVQVWDGTTGNVIVTYQGHTNTVWAAGWAPDEQRVVSVSADGTAQVWDASTGTTIVTYTRHATTVRSVSWSPDGQRIATASEDQTVHIWNASTGETLLIYRGHSGLMRTVSWSPDGRRIVSGAKDATAQIWNATTGAILYVYRGHSATVFDAQWSPDGARIVSGSTDTTARVWQAS